MNLQSTESVSSSNAGSGFHEVDIKSAFPNHYTEQDDLLQTSSFEAGVFGVLFTLEEKDHQQICYHWIILKYFVTAWQIYITILTPEFGWDIEPHSAWWRFISVLNFKWFRDVGYQWYVAALYTFAALLTANLALCVWVAWSFKEQKFYYVWPIKVLRYFAYVFLKVFDMTSLSFLQLGISCGYSAHGLAHLRMELFPQYSCQQPAQIINAIVSGLLLLVFAVTALLFNMAEVEVNPASKLPQALGHSGSAMTVFVIKALMTLVGVFLGWPKVAAAAYCVLAAWLMYEYLRWVPSLQVWDNCVKTGVATAMLSTAALQVAVVLLPRKGPCLTTAMALSLGPAFIAGAAAAYLRLKLFDAAVRRAFRNANPEAIKPQDIYHFVHPRDVEVAARCARVWTNIYTLDKTAVHRAEEIIKAGVALFPGNAFLALVYANFMLDMLGFSQTGAKQLESVRKFNPSLMCRFMLFVRHQQATQKAASSTVGKGGNMDLLGYVEYQRKQRTVLRHHKDALQAMANFWRILGFSSVSFTSLSRSLENIDNSVSKAESAYRVAMELYNNSPRLVRLYARFMETIKQDPWAASQYYEMADRLEEANNYNGQGPSLPDGTPMSHIDEVEKGILVVNAFGDIQVANRKLHDMFGYEKGELDGKNVTALMPPHEAKRHPLILRHYIDSGDKAAPYFRHPVLGMHRERVAITVRIAVSRASGLGEDSVFIGILELVPCKPGVGRVWVTPEGIIMCCDPGFVTCFGYHPEDVIGMHLDKLLYFSAGESGGSETVGEADVWATNQANHDNQELIERMLANAANAQQWNDDDPFSRDATQYRVLHRYDFAKSCFIAVRKDSREAAVLEVRMKLVSDESQLLMVVERKGAIRHMSGDLAKVLGVQAGGRDELDQHIADGDNQVMLELTVKAPPCCLDDILPSPWRAMHYKFTKYVKGGSHNLAGAWGCRAAMNGSSNFAGPTMKLMGMHGKPVYVHVAVSSKEEDGEPMHVVRMARSSLETAIAERRVRMRVSLEGVVQELQQHDSSPVAHANPDGLFGFPPEELLGCRFCDFLSLAVRRGARHPAALDLLSEAELAVAGVVPAGGHGLSDLEGPGSLPGEVGWEPLDLATYGDMVTSALKTPGISWRVNIVSPRVAVEATALGNSARTAAVLAKHTKPAILKLDVVIPKPSPLGAYPEKLAVHAEIWFAEAVMGVLEVDGRGKISGIVEEEMRPPGLLFGFPKEDILGAELGDLLRFQPGQSPVGLLTDSGIAKKSALKANSRKGKVMVGPLHHLEGFHRDHQPLHLTVQVVGKPGLGNTVIAVIRFASSKQPPPPADTIATVKPGGLIQGPGDGGAFSGGNLAHTRVGHVCLNIGSMPLNDSGDGGGGGGGAPITPRGPTSLRLRGSFMTRIDTRTAATAPLTAPLQTGVPLSLGCVNASGMMVGVTDADAPPTAAAALSQPSPPLPLATLTMAPPAFSLTPVTMPRVAGPGVAVGDTAAASVAAAAAVLPGANALAGAEARPMKARNSLSLEKDTVSKGGADFTAGNNSPPEKPGSPPLAGPRKVYSRRPSLAAMSKRTTEGSVDVGSTAAAGHVVGSLPGVPTSNSDEDVGQQQVALTPAAKETNEAAEDGKPAVGRSRMSRSGTAGVKLDAMSLAATDAGSEELGVDDMAGAGNINTWVATGGKFFRNKVESMDGFRRVDGPDLGEDDDDGAGSFGGFSRATSSHFTTSPRGSLYGGPTEQPEELQPHPWQQHHHSHHQQQQQLQHQLQGQHPHQQQQQNQQKAHQHHPYKQHQYQYQHQNQYQTHSHQEQYQQHRHQNHHPTHPHQQQYQQHPHPHLHAHQRHGFVGGGDPMASGDLLVAAAAAGAGGLADGGDYGAAIGFHPKGHQVGPGSFQHSGSMLSDAAAKVLEAMSLDQGDEHDSEGESDISSIVNESDESGTEDAADYKRGKRYRKLIKLMNSPQAKQAVVRLKIHTMLALLAAVSIHVLSFSLIINSIHKQSHALDGLAEAGGGQRYLQRALVAVRALDQVYKGKGSNVTYGPKDAQVFADDILSYADMYRAVSRGLLQQDRKVEQLFYSSKIQVWSGVNATTNASIFEDITLWDMVTRVYISAKAVFQNHVFWHKQGLNLSSQLPIKFLLYSGQALSSPGLRPVANTLLDVAITWTHNVNQLQLTFLVVEGLCVAGCCAAGLAYMLKSAFDQRYQLYETFLSIPIGLTRALAAQTTHLLDDESDSSQSDEDDEKEPYEDGGPSITDRGRDAKRKALFNDSPVLLDRGNKGDDAAGEGRSGGEGGDGRNLLDGDEVGCVITGKLQAKSADVDILRGPCSPPYRVVAKTRLSFKQSKLMSPDSCGPLGDLSLLTPTAGPINSPVKLIGRGHKDNNKRLRALCSSCLSLFLRPFWKSRSVGPITQPAGPLSPGPNKAGQGLVSQPRRTLIRNSKVAKGMLSIVLFYSFLVILFYSVNYAILKKLEDQVALQAVADQNAERTYRTVFYAQELMAEEDPAGIPERVAALQNATTALRDAYYTMRMGSAAWTVVGSDMEHFPSVSGNGLIKGSSDMFRLFYSEDSCLRLPEHLPCPPRDYRYYEVTRAGADGMLNRMLNELSNLADEAMAAMLDNRTLGLNSTRWDFIYNVGTVDLNDVGLRISAQHITDVKDVLKIAVALHVVLLLLLMGLVLSFLVMGYLPLLHRMEKEKRRIAEMMSQLPTELDVMRLFSAALLGTSKGGHLHGRQPQAGGGDGGSGRSCPGPNRSVHGAECPAMPSTSALGPGAVTVQVAAGNLAAWNGGPVKSGEDTNPCLTLDGSGGVSKGYQAWKGILARASHSGTNGVPIATAPPRAPKGKPLTQL